MLGVDTIRSCGGEQVCDPEGTCVDCITAADCNTSNAPYCSNNSCVGSCATAQDCVGVAGKPFCAPDGTCVECLEDNQCPTSAPVCDVSNASCRGCAADDECPSIVCDVDTGGCVATASILYASPSGTDLGDCSQAAPCSLAKAIAQATTLRSTIRMLPGRYATAISLMAPSPDISIVGPGATLTGNSTPEPAALVVEGTARISVRGLTVDVTGGPQSVAVRCDPFTGGDIGSLTLHDVSILGNEMFSGNCQFTMIHSTVRNQVVLNGMGTVKIDRSLVSGVLGVGQIASSPISVTNSIIGGASFSQVNPIAVTMTFNTFFLATPGASLPCSAGGVLFQDNIVLAPNSANAVTGTTCQFAHNIAFPQAMNVGTGTIRMDPLLVDPATGNFHLQGLSPAVDAADSTPDAIDFDGTPRPQGARADIGAFESHP